MRVSNFPPFSVLSISSIVRVMVDSVPMISAGISKENLQVVAYMNDPEAIKNSVAAGLGISIVSKKAAENMITEKRLLSFEFSRYTSGRKFYIIYKKDYLLKPFISIFINYIRTLQVSDKQTARNGNYEQFACLYYIRL